MAAVAINDVVAKCLEIGMEEFPHGIPHTWKRAQWREAFAYSWDFYGPDGLYKSVPNPTREEFRVALLADFEATINGEVEYPLWDAKGWEWASVERERVRDRIRIARGQSPIGYFGVKECEPMGWPRAAEVSA